MYVCCIKPFCFVWGGYIWEEKKTWKTGIYIYIYLYIFCEFEITNSIHQIKSLYILARASRNTVPVPLPTRPHISMNLVDPMIAFICTLQEIEWFPVSWIFLNFTTDVLFLALSLFSPTRPSGPSWSSSLNVCHRPSCPLFMWLFSRRLIGPYVFFCPKAPWRGQRRRGGIKKCLKASWRQCYYPHRSRELLSPVCGIFIT